MSAAHFDQKDMNCAPSVAGEGGAADGARKRTKNWQRDPYVAIDARVTGGVEFSRFFGTISPVDSSVRMMYPTPCLILSCIDTVSALMVTCFGARGW
jgi:hypothetical protein